MLEEITNLIGLEAYTPWGVRIGVVNEAELDPEENTVSGLLIEETNMNLVERGAPLLVPFRWIQSIGDIIILRHFPEDLPIPAPAEYGLDEYR